MLIEILGKLFKRNKAPVVAKAMALLSVIAGASIRTAAFSTGLSKTAVHYLFMKFREIVGQNAKGKHRVVAVDETVLKVNGMNCWIYAAIDLKTKELLLVKAYPTRNYQTTMGFLSELKNFGVRVVVTDKMPAYSRACQRLGLHWIHETYGLRNRIEHVFRSLKHRTKRFNNNINVNQRLFRLDRNFIHRRRMEILGLWCNYLFFLWNEVLKYVY